MKKKFLSLLLALAMVTALLAGCGASSGSNAGVKYESSMEMPAATEAVSGTLSSVADSASQQTTTEQKLIKKVTMDAETEDLEALLPQLNQKIADLGGYTQSQDIYNGSNTSSYRYRSASMTIRIPAENLSGFVDQIEGIANVVSYQESVDDVTLTYVATESRITALETEQTRLLELLAKAENMTDLLTIEERLTEVRYELESTTSQLRVLANQVSYATINLSISQVKVYTEVEEKTVWQRIGSGFVKNLKNIWESLTDLFVWMVTYSPQLIFWGAVITLVVVLLRRRTRKRKVTQVPRDTQPPTEQA